MHDPKNVKVALLQGGNSSEREISLLSGEGANEALIEAGYTVERLDPAEKKDLLRLLNGEYDVAFICLHGEGGEDGKIQGFLETIGLPYTCSGVASSAICMDKMLTKRFYTAAGIPTPASLEIPHPNTVDEDAISRVNDQICQEMGEKCVIKIPLGGSSIGVFIAKNAEEIGSALSAAFQESETVLVEKYIDGREVTTVVLELDPEEDRSSNNEAEQGEGSKSSEESEPISSTGASSSACGNREPQPTPRALPIIEIIPANDSYDYDSKYLPGGSKHICPAELLPEITAVVQDFAVRAHKALGCSGVSRTDFMIDNEGNAWALETNTVPGMTGTSLLPDAARAAGISFPDLCVQLIENAFLKKNGSNS